MNDLPIKRMETNRDELSRIKEVLKRNPKGMNVIEIAQAIDMHRQSVTKYVEMLVVSGQVEMKSFGPSKVYYLSQRLPISAMLSLSSDMILLLDRDLKIINVNDALLTFISSSREKILNKEMNMVSFPLEFDPPILPFISDALQGKESRIEAQFKKKKEEQFFIIKFIPVVFDDGQPGATVLFENVTNQKNAEREREKLIARLQATKDELHTKNTELEDQIQVRKLVEKALRDSQSKLEAIFTGMNDAILTIDKDGKIFLLNDACARYYRFKAGEDQYKSLHEIYDTLDVFSLDGAPLPPIDWPSSRAHRGEILRDVEVLIKKKGTDESWIGSYNSERIHDEKGDLLFTLLIARDITESVRVRDELAKAKAQAEIYMDLLDNDIANLHQIALGQLELAHEIMAEKGMLASEDMEMIDTPLESLLRSTRLIDNVHRLNKLIRFKNQVGNVDLDQLLAEVVRENSGGRGDGLTINYTPAAGCQVVANSMLKDVFNNLVGYAINRAGGKVTIDISVDRSGQNGSSFYCVTIEDDGPGIPDEKKGDVFHRFKSSHSEAGSIVLGQYIVKTLVENFNGHIRVEDRVPGDYSKGSRFVVDLPVAAGENTE